MTIEMLDNQFREPQTLMGKSIPSEEDVEFHTMTSISILKSRGMNARESAYVINLMSRFNKWVVLHRIHDGRSVWTVVTEMDRSALTS